MNSDAMGRSILESSALLLSIWAGLRLLPAVPANAKAWIWRLAFLKPVFVLLPFAAVTLRILPPPPPVAPSDFPSLPPDLSAKVARTAPIPPDNPRPDTLLLIWCAGAVGVVGLGAGRRLSAARIAARSIPINSGPIAETYRDLAERLGRETSGLPILAAAPDVECPMFVGGWCPRIVLPASATASDARMMLAHEVAHWRRRDLAWLTIIWLVQAAFFFNPVVWLAAYAARQDHESAADEFAARLAATPVDAYADMLVRTSICVRPSLSIAAPGTISMAGSPRAVRRRLEAMKHFHKKPLPAYRFAAVAMAALTICLLPSYRLAEAQALAGAPPGTQSRPQWGSVPYAGPIVIHNFEGVTEVDLEFSMLDIRQALIRLFEAAHHPYRIELNINGMVTVALKNVTFENALHNITRQVDATFEVKDGTYVVRRHSQAEIEAIRQEQLRIEKAGRDYLRTHPPHPAALGSFVVAHGDVREAIRRLMRMEDNLSYLISPTVQGTVSLSVTNMPFNDVLSALLRQVDAKFEVKDGIYEITSKNPQDAARTQNSNAGPSPLVVKSFSVKRAEIRDAVMELMAQSGVPTKAFVMARQVKGTVTLNAFNMPFNDVLTALLRQVKAKYRIENGFYMITPAT